ncbi:hypothetical protein MLD38_009180 [Melastoma candidum]|uniref:Uncharacterized protein n=1 Tax=Melastoma candidum TaxID=119954 RepID=A0ACB9RXA0_9MYRT|nr:hypothetical protein MLD38_009180 [Melastoma candidum]
MIDRKRLVIPEESVPFPDTSPKADVMGSSSGTKSDAEAPQNKLSDKAKKLVDDIQTVLAKFVLASTKPQADEINSLVEEVLRLGNDLKSEINASCPASPIPADSLGSFLEIQRMLQLYEEQDDATSNLVELTGLKTETDASLEPTYLAGYPENHFNYFEQNECIYPAYCNGNATSNLDNAAVSESDLSAYVDYLQFDLHHPVSHGENHDHHVTKQLGDDSETCLFPYVSPPPAAFMGPKCALWDCQRPAQGSDLCKDYCSSMHADLAFNEGGAGLSPVLRPGGTGLKDDRLLSALVAKMDGKFVGIPECPGAAVEKSPWNASKLFDLSLLEGETIREWLFFDKPRKAFEVGSRKQRSLSDHNGRRWHESRKLVMKELEGHKRTYYMDPQPPGNFEWHLCEYDINRSDALSLYKLELKVVSEKKNPKSKVAKDALADLQNQMGRLNADGSPEMLSKHCTSASKSPGSGHKGS